MKLSILTAITILASFAGAQEPEDYESVLASSTPSVLQMQPTNRQVPVVLVKINGQGPFRFGLDTCAQHAGMISADLAAKLKLEPAGKVEIVDGSGKNPRSINIYSIENLQVGDALFGSVKLAEHSVMSKANSPQKEEGLDGILGFGLWKELLLDIDFANRKVTISKGSLPEADSIPFRMPNGIPSIDMNVAGQVFDCHVDTGSDGAITVPSQTVKSLPTDGEPKKIGRGVTVSNIVDIYQVKLKGTVRVDKAIFENPDVDYSDIFHHAILGSRAMKPYRLTIDEAHTRLRLGP